MAGQQGTILPFSGLGQVLSGVPLGVSEPEITNSKACVGQVLSVNGLMSITGGLGTTGGSLFSPAAKPAGRKCRASAVRWPEFPKTKNFNFYEISELF